MGLWTEGGHIRPRSVGETSFSILDWILTPIPGLSSLTGDTWICAREIAGPNLCSPTGAAHVQHEVRGRKSSYQVVLQPPPKLHWIHHRPVSLPVLVQVRIGLLDVCITKVLHGAHSSLCHHNYMNYYSPNIIYKSIKL